MKHLKTFEAIRPPSREKILNYYNNEYLYLIDEEDLIEAYEYLLNLNTNPKAFYIKNFKYYGMKYGVLFKINDNVPDMIINRSASLFDFNDLVEIHDVNLYLSAKKYNL